MWQMTVQSRQLHLQIVISQLQELAYYLQKPLDQLLRKMNGLVHWMMLGVRGWFYNMIISL